MYFRPWESSTGDNSQANQLRNDAGSVPINQHGNSVDTLQTNQHGFGKDASLDNYVSTKHLQVVTRLTNLLQLEGSVAQQLHRYYIESLTQLQSFSCISTQQPSEHQKEILQSSKQQYEDLFFLINRQCEVLENHMHGCIKNGITRPLCGATSGDLSLAREDHGNIRASHAQYLPSHLCNSNNRLLNKHAIKVLNHWYVSNQHHPYLTAADALQLAMECGIRTIQVRKWMSNRRTRSQNTKRQRKLDRRNAKKE